MNKILEFGRKTMFYVRVLSGYEEYRIRSMRLQLEQRVKSAQQRKLAVNKIPEQLVLSEVRRMVEEMKNLNKSLEDTEVSINEYFKPLDKEAEALINMQLENEKAKGEMMAAMYKQAMYEKVEAEAAIEVNKAKMIQQKLERESQTADEPQKAAQTR